MNTNSNTYTVVYTTVIVVLVAAVLAFVSQSLKGRQEANEKADTISQMMTAAKFDTKAGFQAMGNTAVLAKYDEEIAEAFTVNVEGVKVADLDRSKVYSPSELKAQNYLFNHSQVDQMEVPVFIFKNGTTVVPVYGAGLWGPVWGYIAFESDNKTIVGAYFDHDSETAGLGSKIKDDPEFQAQFCGEYADFEGQKIFAIVKGGAPKDEQGVSLKDNAIDAISGATMTSNGLDKAINNWLSVYKAYFTGAEGECGECTGECGSEKPECTGECQKVNTNTEEE